MYKNCRSRDCCTVLCICLHYSAHTNYSNQWILKKVDYETGAVHVIVHWNGFQLVKLRCKALAITWFTAVWFRTHSIIWFSIFVSIWLRALKKHKTPTDPPQPSMLRVTFGRILRRKVDIWVVKVSFCVSVDWVLCFLLVLKFFFSS